MRNVLVTGAKGFIGRNLCARLAVREDLVIDQYDIESSEAELENALSRADIIYHFAGVNRPENVEDFQKGNAGLTKHLCEVLNELGRAPKVIMSSSIQAAFENPYGVSKRQAEGYLQNYSKKAKAPVAIYRLKNVFGKWCKPKYNSVIATFCHNIAHGLPVTISDPSKEIELIYIDDVIDAFLDELDLTLSVHSDFASDQIPFTTITLGDLAGRIQACHDMRQNLTTPDFQQRFNQCLYATYLSYLDTDDVKYSLDVKADERGSLAEFVKSKHFGQIFVSRTAPGVTRGNHYHHTKTEKFFILSGQGVIRLRPIVGDTITEYIVKGESYEVVDIPPGYTHSITNDGAEDLVTLFWASEVFDPDHPDTYYLDVMPKQKCESC